MQSDPSERANAAQHIDDDKRKSTTHTETSSSIVDDEKRGFVTTPRPEVSNEVLDTEIPAEKNESQIVPPANQQEAKDSHIVDSGSIAPNEHAIKKEGESIDGIEEEDNDGIEVIYPGGVQLALLTLGLCLATFTVALGK